MRSIRYTSLVNRIRRQTFECCKASGIYLRWKHRMRWPTPARVCFTHDSRMIVTMRTNLQGLEGQAKTRSMEVIDRFSGYVTELQSILSGTATPESIIEAFGQKSL